MLGFVLSLTFEAFLHLVKLDAPEHEDDAGDHAEDQGVGEVPERGEKHEGL